MPATGIPLPALPNECLQPLEHDPLVVLFGLMSHEQMVKTGDEVFQSGECLKAWKYYTAADDADRLALLQKFVEDDTDVSVNLLVANSRFIEALGIVDGWIARFPLSRRLAALRAKISRLQRQ
jgi:hypothetical protein